MLASFVQSLPRAHRYAVELRHRAFYDDPELEARVERLLGEHDVEWVSLDTTTLYSAVPPSAAERGAPGRRGDDRVQAVVFVYESGLVERRDR